MKHIVAKVGEVEAGQCKLVTIDNKEIGVFLVEGEYRAYRNVCPHAGAPLCPGYSAKGELPPDVHRFNTGMNPNSIQCPYHGWEFSLETGQHDTSRTSLKAFDVEVEGDEISIEVP